MPNCLVRGHRRRTRLILPRRSKQTQKRFEGLKQLAEVGARQISPVDKLYDAKEAFEGGYKLVKAKNPPSLKQVLSLGEITDREEARKERARDR